MVHQRELAPYHRVPTVRSLRRHNPMHVSNMLVFKETCSELDQEGGHFQLESKIEVASGCLEINLPKRYSGRGCETIVTNPHALTGFYASRWS